uniref:Uncharacterized protein n=1 Tax=Marseillevirus LCMAC101 TaxID=2506602 RepID=A0A481YRU7_9VIRU|nr:MAG: hypothetical protein LCMAC101_05260 [Marseillevirus LCMAC101]
MDTLHLSGYILGNSGILEKHDEFFEKAIMRTGGFRRHLDNVMNAENGDVLMYFTIIFKHKDGSIRNFSMYLTEEAIENFRIFIRQK